MLLLYASAAAAPLALGTSATVGAEALAQRGAVTMRPRVDLLDLELHVGDHLQVVPRVGRFAVGLAALEIIDAEIDVLYRIGSTDPGWRPFVAVGGGATVAVGAGDVVLGGTALARVGWAWRPGEGARRVHVFAEPRLALVTGRSVSAGSAGLCAGAAFTWRL